MSQPAPPSSRPVRRTFLRYLIRSLGVLWAGGFAAAALSYLRFPRSLNAQNTQSVEVGPDSDLQPGQGRLVSGDHPPFWVVRSEAGKLIALPAVCTHRHCILAWKPATSTLECPCHGGLFDLNGNVLAGPPPRPLQALNVAVKGGQIHVYL